MSPSKEAKEAGLKNMIELSAISNKPRKTLENWYKSNPQLFKVVVAGCVAVKNER
jgi:hypothetical protein